MVEIVKENGVETRTTVCPEGYVEVDSHTPSITSSDYYGLRHQEELRAVLQSALIESIALVTHKRRISPMGSGPGGRVRFGDDMMPSTYRIAVKIEDQPDAILKLQEHAITQRAYFDQLIAEYQAK